MRVLLPLKAPVAGSQSSSEDLEALEQKEQQASETARAGVNQEDQEQPIVETPHFEGLLLPTGQTSLLSSLRADPVPLEEQKVPSLPFAAASLKTTGLTQESHESRKRSSTTLPRKRPRPSSLQDIAAKPLETSSDRKPAAKPTKKMGLGPPHRKVSPSSWLPQLETAAERPLVTSRNTANSRDTEDEDPATMSARKGPTMNDTIFGLELKKRGLEIREQEGDGNCLFRAVSLQVYGDSSMHGQVRKQCMDFMERDQEHFSQFVTGEEFPVYIRRKRQDGVHGNNPEIQAISELFNRPIEVFSPENGSTPLNIFHAEYKTDDAPIRLSYHDGNHYNAVIDPLVPTAGLGLGLPGLQPGLADKLQVAKAVAESDAAADQLEYERALKESEEDELQRALKDSQLSTEHSRSNAAMAASDVDATYFELEQAAVEHSLQSHIQHEHGKKKSANSTHLENGSGRPLGLSENERLTSSPGLPSGFASLPVPIASIPSVASSVASLSSGPSVASAPAAAAAAIQHYEEETPIRAVDEYSPVIQEMVMNGFELSRVVRAAELIGENFDDLLAFLMSSNAN